MLKSDRFIVAGSLALSCAALIFALRASVTPMAMAGLPLANDLGPADALLLTTEAGKDALRVSAKDGHIAWGDRATNRAWSVAAVDIDKVMKKLLEGASYAEKRNEIKDKIEKGEADFQKRAEDIQAKFPVAPGGPPPAEGQAAFQQLQQEYRMFRESIGAESDRLAAEQFEASYRELVVAVETVSEKESIDLVLRFQPTADPFEAKGSAEAIDRIRARTLLKYPTQVDITPEVMKARGI
ncbi:MAG: OmpH family outer membrane protein [Planctomycetota bacterium]